MLSFAALQEFMNVAGRHHGSVPEYTTAFLSKYSRAKSASGLTINDSALAMLMLLNSGLPNEDFTRVLSSTAAGDGSLDPGQDEADAALPLPVDEPISSPGNRIASG